MESKNGCLICGAELEYFGVPRKLTCAVCGRVFEANAACKSGHFVCDACHGDSADSLIRAVCLNTPMRDPVKLAQSLMGLKPVHMHGPEHHVLVGSALLAAYHNCGGELDLEKSLTEMQRRGKQVPGGACGFWGCCGAAVSAGMFVSIISGSTPLKNEEWALSNLMTSEALKSIAECGGPRCCKRDSFLAIIAAVRLVRERFGVEMELPERTVCRFRALNRECIGERCPFLPDPRS